MKYVVARLKKNALKKYSLIWGQQIDPRDVVLLTHTLYSRKDSAMRFAKRAIGTVKLDSPILVLQVYSDERGKNRVYVIRAVLEG